MQADGGQLSGALQGQGSPRGRRRLVHLQLATQKHCIRPLSFCQTRAPPHNAEWKPMYQPTPEQAEADRRAAYESGVPHGYVAPGDRYKGLPTITLTVVSDLVRLKGLQCGM